MILRMKKKKILVKKKLFIKKHKNTEREDRFVHN